MSRDISIIESKLTLREPTNEEMTANKGNAILGVVSGPHFAPNQHSRNGGRYYGEDLWRKVIEEDQDVSRRANGNTMYGTIGHDLEIDEKALREGLASHYTKNLTIAEDKNSPSGLMGHADSYIIDTPAGRALYAYLKSGGNWYVSSRADGSYKGEINGKPRMDANSYKLERFDFVTDPGFLVANPKLVQEAIISENLQKITESYNMATKNEDKGDANVSPLAGISDLPPDVATLNTPPTDQEIDQEENEAQRIINLKIVVMPDGSVETNADDGKTESKKGSNMSKKTAEALGTAASTDVPQNAEVGAVRPESPIPEPEQAEKDAQNAKLPQSSTQVQAETPPADSAAGDPEKKLDQSVTGSDGAQTVDIEGQVESLLPKYMEYKKKAEAYDRISGKAAKVLEELGAEPDSDDKETASDDVLDAIYNGEYQADADTAVANAAGAVQDAAAASQGVEADKLAQFFDTVGSPEEITETLIGLKTFVEEVGSLDECRAAIEEMKAFVESVGTFEEVASFLSESAEFHEKFGDRETLAKAMESFSKLQFKNEALEISNRTGIDLPKVESMLSKGLTQAQMVEHFRRVTPANESYIRSGKVQAVESTAKPYMIQGTRLNRVMERFGGKKKEAVNTVDADDLAKTQDSDEIEQWGVQSRDNV